MHENYANDINFEFLAPQSGEKNPTFLVDIVEP